MPTIPATTSPRIPVKRRNGKLQSCEPCRNRKVSCDHRLPSCNRCIKRGTSNLCYYHPAPMTKPVATAAILPSPAHTVIPSPANSVPRSGQSVQRVESPSLAVRSGTVPPVDRFPKILSVPSAGILFEPSETIRSVGFLGQSSSTAVVAELNNSLGINVPELPNEPRAEGLSDALIRRGVQVLSFFQDEARIKKSLDQCFSTGDGEAFFIFRPVYIAWLDGFLPVLKESTKSNTLEALSAKIWLNTQKPLTCTRSATAMDWAFAATGGNTRWETLGLLLALAGFFTLSLPSWHPTFGSGPKNGRSQLRQTVLDLVNMCVEFSKASGSRNELLAILLYDRFLFVAMIRGDTSTEAWTSFSEVCDTVTLLGIHLGNRADAQTPFFLCELRIRLFVVCFTMDKFLSTFLGRPPRISYRYSILEEPHDLTDEEMCLDEAGLRAAISALDHGWNTSRRITRASWRKAGYRRGEIGEDILEIAIGPHCRDLESRVEQVRQRRKNSLAAMPDFARIDVELVMSKLQTDPNFSVPGRDHGWTPFDMQCLLSYNCFLRHGEFLLERAIFNRYRTDSSRLVASAKSLLNLVTKAYSLKDFCWQFQCDITDMLAFYAVPPAGILAMEMLKRDQINDPDDTFPRSETVQQLCILVGALEAVNPDEGNYAVCAMGLSAIKKVLDRLLSKPPPRPVSSNNVPQQGLSDDHYGVYIDNDAEFLRWMDSVDFNPSMWDPMHVQATAS